MSPNCTSRSWPPSIPRWHLTTTHMCRFRSGSRPMARCCVGCLWLGNGAQASTERGRGQSAHADPGQAMRSPSFMQLARCVRAAQLAKHDSDTHDSKLGKNLGAAFLLLSSRAAINRCLSTDPYRCAGWARPGCTRRAGSIHSKIVAAHGSWHASLRDLLPSSGTRHRQRHHPPGDSSNRFRACMHGCGTV